MKTIHNKIKVAVGLLCIAALVVSCLPETQTIGDAGQTLVKLYPGGFKAVAFNAVTTAQSAVLFAIRRDVNSEEAVNSTTTVELTLDQAVLDEYNTDNGTTFIPLPTSLGTTNPVVTSGKMTITFNPGEFAKEVLINIPNATNFDFSKSYALAFKVNSVSGTGTLSKAVSDKIIAQVMVKNKYDGVYKVEGTLVDLVVATISGNYPMTVHLVTTGKSQVRFEEPADEPWGSRIFHSITSGGSMSVYGSFGLVISFDDSDNVTSVVNYYGQPAGNTRSAELDPSGVNKYNPATKTVNIKYFMKQTSSVPTPPNIRTTFDEVWTYTGPR